MDEQDAYVCEYCYHRRSMPLDRVCVECHLNISLPQVRNEIKNYLAKGYIPIGRDFAVYVFTRKSMFTVKKCD